MVRGRLPPPPAQSPQHMQGVLGETLEGAWNLVSEAHVVSEPQAPLRVPLE